MSDPFAVCPWKQRLEGLIRAEFSRPFSVEYSVIPLSVYTEGSGGTPHYQACWSIIGYEKQPFFWIFSVRIAKSVAAFSVLVPYDFQGADRPRLCAQVQDNVVRGKCAAVYRNYTSNDDLRGDRFLEQYHFEAFTLPRVLEEEPRRNT